MKPKIEHLGIIMDGNRRWAKARRLLSFEGHRAGYNKIEEVLNWCNDAGIKILTLFVFSTENWKRSKEEVDFLMKILYRAFTKDVKKLHQHNVCVRVIGRKEGMPEKVKKAMLEAEALTKNNAASVLNLAINYGGRSELIDAFNKIAKNPSQKITEDLISKNTYTAGLPDPDLIIRTSGEYRLSGFLTWQSAYSELHFTKHHWPEFSKKDFDGALADFADRQRRFGK